jgi:hypothetical protein
MVPVLTAAGQSSEVQDALPIVIVAVVVAAGLVGVAAMLLSRGPYDRIGRSGLTFDSEPEGVDADSSREAQEMLAASNARRAAKGLAPRALADFGAPDPALEAEVRAFVLARNERLIARGKPPLDVEAEVERRLRSQDG